jgi:uncharacterized protein YbjT (DUF2867 family)
MTITLVLGATGKVGRELVKELHTPNTQVRLGVRKQPLDVTYDTVQFDFDVPATYAKAFDGVDKLFLLTPFVENQVDLTKRVLDAATKAGVKHVVRVSAMGAGPESIRLGRDHYEAEQLIEQSGIAFTHLRPNAFMQNFIQMFAHTIKSHNQFYLPLGDAKVSYIDTKDIARVAAAILRDPEQHAGKAYTLTGPQALSGEEIAKIFTKVLGRPVEYADVTEDKAKEGIKAMPAPQWMVDALMELFDIQKKGYAAEVTNTVYDITKVRPNSFLQFAAENAAVFK